MSIAPTPTGQQGLSGQSAEFAGRFASEYLHALPPDQEFSARAFFDRFPECARFKSVVLEVTLEEFVRRSCRGEQVVPSQIAGQFPAYHSAIARQIEVYQFLEESAGLDEKVHWPEPGDAFLGLKLRELLGVGAFSKVFLATEERLGDRQVVVKVCQGAGEEPAFLGRLGHPHITPIHWHQVCGSTGLSAIVMPYLARSTMADVIDHCYSSQGRAERAADVGQAIADLHPDSHLTLERTAFGGTFAGGALRWARQLADALAFAHQHRICHSDIKPSNVLLTPAGNAVLVDFSMANDLSIDRKTAGGTFPYMAPEQLEAFLSGGDIPVSFATDLFSLGVTLYEFLTGRPPFGCPPADESRRATAAWLLNRQRGDVKPVSRVNPRIPESMSAIVMACLAIDPARRPRSARELCAHLKREASVSRSILNSCRRHTRKLSAVCGCIVIAGSLAVVHSINERPDYVVVLERARTEIAAEDFATAVASLDDALDRMPADDRSALARTLFLRGCALLRVDRFSEACGVFEDVKAIAGDSGPVFAALGFCRSHLGLSERMRDSKTDSDAKLLIARHLFELAIDHDWGTPEVLFDLAYLDFREVPTGRPELADLLNRRDKAEQRQSKLKEISQQLESLSDELGETPNYHQLLIQVEAERALREERPVNRTIIETAASCHANDLGILLEAARCYAINARRDDTQPGDRTGCADCWSRAVQQGATEADLANLATLLPDIEGDPQFSRPAPNRGHSRATLPPDLLLNPVQGVETAFSAQIAATGT